MLPGEEHPALPLTPSRQIVSRARTAFYTLLRSFRPFCSRSLSLFADALADCHGHRSIYIAANEGRAVRNIESNVDAKLIQMKWELKEECESADERLVKKIRLDSKPTFRKCGHEKQFMFNEQI